MVTRGEVLRTARTYLDLAPWRPFVDEFAFDAADLARTFHSAFRAGRSEYTVFPYVYGGTDTPEIFRRRIAERDCPGGWDRVSGQGTSHWQSKVDGGFGLRLAAPRNLAGIDCSAYVSNCWKLPRAWSTFELPRICTRVPRSELRSGDILNRRKSHVRLFERTDGSDRVWVYESRGGGGRRAWREGDEQGCVVHRSVPWDSGYLPMTPFPVLIDTERMGTEIRGVFAGKGTLEVLSLVVDGSQVRFKVRARTGGARGLRTLEASAALGPRTKAGHRRATAVVVNRVGGQRFQDTISWAVQES